MKTTIFTSPPPPAPPPPHAMRAEKWLSCNMDEAERPLCLNRAKMAGKIGVTFKKGVPKFRFEAKLKRNIAKLFFAK